MWSVLLITKNKKDAIISMKRRIFSILCAVVLSFSTETTAFAVEKPLKNIQNGEMEKVQVVQDLIDLEAEMVETKIEDLGNGVTVESALYVKMSDSKSTDHLIYGVSVENWKRNGELCFIVYVIGAFTYNGSEAHVKKDECEIKIVSYDFSESRLSYTKKPEYIEVAPDRKVHFGGGYDIYLDSKLIAYGYDNVSCTPTGNVTVYSNEYVCLF